MKIQLKQKCYQFGYSLIEILLGIYAVVVAITLAGIFMYMAWDNYTNSWKYFLPNGQEVSPPNQDSYDPIGSATNAVYAKVEFLNPS